MALILPFDEVLLPMYNFCLSVHKHFRFAHKDFCITFADEIIKQRN